MNRYSVSLPVCAILAAGIFVPLQPAQAQRDNAPSYDQNSRPDARQPDARQSGDPFTIQNDDLRSVPDQRRTNDPRYSQSYAQQPPPKPGGGCLKYGAGGAVAGHFAGHGVLGAVAGCATGAYVRHRDKQRIEEQYGR